MPAVTPAAVRAVGPEEPEQVEEVEAAEGSVRVAAWARALLDAGLLELPLPGRGRTRERFRALAMIGSVDLGLARLAEAHTDAIAIQADLGTCAAGPGLWGVWAANPPVDPLRATRTDGGWVLDGRKQWCSGAGCCDHALVTALAGDGYRMFAVDMSHPGAAAVDGSWPAVAMRGSDSRSVDFHQVPAVALGPPEGYLDRPGFWHGAVGVAAAWWGGALGVADALARADVRRPLHAHALAHAGAVDAALIAAQQVLDWAADEFDNDPNDVAGAARLTAGRVRAVVEDAATTVLDRTGRALGAAPLAMDVEHGRRVADLTLYLRQSHAERDLEALGRASLDSAGFPWHHAAGPA